MVTSSEDRALLWSRDFVVRSPFRFGESYGQRSHEFYTVYSTTTNNSKPRPQCNTRRRPATCEARLTTALVTPPYIGHKCHRGAWGNARRRATFTSALTCNPGCGVAIQDTPPSPSQYMMLFLRHTGSLSLYTTITHLHHVCPL